jgi:molybdopterin-guanine dinucleotide biosynthesis protein A
VIHSDVSAAIVAGGQARRLGGRDKSRLVVRGRPIIVRQVDILQRVAASVFVVSSQAERISTAGVPVHPDVVTGAGAIGGLLTALEVATTDLVLVVACDLPFLNERLLQRLVGLARTADASWVETSHGAEPLLACYRRTARTAVRAAIDAGHLRLGDLDRVLRVARLGEAELASFGPPDELLANVNTPEDLGRVQ